MESSDSENSSERGISGEGRGRKDRERERQRERERNVREERKLVGKKREREREESASNADIRHTTSNAAADRPTLKTPLDQL